MNGTTSSPIRKKKKTLNACLRCRTRKIKCSGYQPCQHCLSQKRDCVFDEKQKKVVVTAEYLQELQHLASGGADQFVPQQSPPLCVARLAPFTTKEHEGRRPGMPRTASVLTPPPPGQAGRFSRIEPAISYPISRGMHTTDKISGLQTSDDSLGGRRNIVNSDHDSPDAIGDEYRRLGHSSSWSFSRRIRSFISDKIEGPGLHDAIPIPDGIYGIPFKQPVLDISGIDMPTEDYAEYLTNTLQFSLSPMYYLFDKDAFLMTLHQFYRDQHSTSTLWKIQMLIVFAFGTSILAREAGRSGPAGAAYFARAVEALPDPHRLRQDPILSIEVLCLLALFMQAMDMRRGAYDYIGQALHICLTQGLNRRFDAQRITKQEFDHRSKLWWTVYVIERKLSSLVGVPPALHDEDIALTMPSIDPAHKTSLTMAFHIEVSSQLGQILNVVYGLGHQRQLGAKFISAVQTILRRLADTSILLNTNMKIESQGSNNAISRVAASLHLLHHQCTILTIRPVLFFLLETKLSSGNAPLKLSDAVIGLLRVCVESALQVLKTVEGLRAHNLVDLFLPFDLESMFASAFVLTLVGIIIPAATEQWELRKTLTLMDEMIMRGIVVAGPYKKDLQELDDLRQRLKSSQTSDSEPPLESLSHHRGVTAPSPGPQLGEDMIWSWVTLGDDELGIPHPDTMQSAIEGLNFDFLNDPSGLDIADSEWMWDAGLPANLNITRNPHD
ncbi:fungal-specific transcription factor domain-containing protein [Rhexocercosporidium sp. MPI-PUGE-AT-0058]|nr:fungal-specific transcription factor domain-containing protein [Rhexocercosporidium sp. MPI-PUGE-AT-0058]